MVNKVAIVLDRLAELMLPIGCISPLSSSVVLVLVVVSPVVAIGSAVLVDMAVESPVANGINVVATGVTAVDDDSLITGRPVSTDGAASVKEKAKDDDDDGVAD